MVAGFHLVWMADGRWAPKDPRGSWHAAASRLELIQAGRRAATHPVWGGKGWRGFLFTVADIRRTIAYIEQNPVKAGRPAQAWPFVKPYDGWLPGRYR